MGVLFLALCAIAGGAAADHPSNVAYWRFEGGEIGKPVAAVWDVSGKFEATATGKAPVVSGEVPLAVIPATAAANHQSLSFQGGYLRVKSQPEIGFSKDFTVELWACFGPPTAAAQVLVSKGEATPGKGNWHLIYQTDGTVQANVFGSAVAYLFDAQSGGPVPGIWYHLAALYEETGHGATRIRAYVNGQLRGVALAPVSPNTTGADLFIGAHTDGSVPFLGQLDELRLTPGLLAPRDFLTGGAQPIPGVAGALKPLFVRPGTPSPMGINTSIRAQPQRRASGVLPPRALTRHSVRRFRDGTWPMADARLGIILPSSQAASASLPSASSTPGRRSRARRSSGWS